MFHVEPVAGRQAGQRVITGVESSDDELCGDVTDLCEQALKVRLVELGGRVIHE